MREDPHAVLKIIWPYVSHASQKAQVLDITARDLVEH